MPWTPSDAQSKTHKANTPAKRRQFADVANSVREREMAKGRSEKEADAAAVRTANGVVKNHPSRKRK
jgi:hypothetical protein